MLLLAYSHESGQNKEVKVADSPPLSPTTGYSHTTLSNFLPGIESKDVAAVRFRCTSQAHRRIVHFTSTQENIKNDAIFGKQTTDKEDWTNAKTLSDHTGYLPKDTSHTSKGTQGFTNQPFYSNKEPNRYWSIQNGGKWQCDDDNDQTSVATNHQVWVRLKPGVLGAMTATTKLLTQPRSCSELLAKDLTLETGWHTIFSPAGPGRKLRVWCDMVTDGGGYTLYPVTNGKSVSRADQENSCTDLGLQLMVWRTRGHQIASLKAPWLQGESGQSYFRVVPGVVGVKTGSFTNVAMNSNTTAKASFVAVDGGDWFISGTNRANAPNGDYSPGCFLGVNEKQSSWKGGSIKPETGRVSWQGSKGATGSILSDQLDFDDSWCEYSTGPRYVCSTNDKGGVGILYGY